MDLQLTNKKVLVTGSTAGIGFAIASLLVEEGASVVVNGRSQRRVEEAVQRIRAERKNAQVTGVAADLGTKEGVNLLIRDLPTVDILVNNLGIFEPKPFAEITDEDWLRFFEVNVLSGVRVSRFYLPKMLQKTGAELCSFQRVSDQHPGGDGPLWPHEDAQLALRGLAELTAGIGVTVNSVLPGPTRSEGVERFVEDLTKAQGTDGRRSRPTSFRPYALSLLKRFATPEEWRRWWSICAAHWPGHQRSALGGRRHDPIHRLNC